MRIDYSEPRRSYVSTPGGPISHRSSGGSGNTVLVGVLVAGGLMFAVGFGTGWYFSQQSAKKAFRAAMEQQSLESAPKDDKKAAQPVAPAATPAQPGATPTVAAPGTQAGASQPGSAPAATAPNQPLTFFDNLPKGQKNAVLGSGINEKPKPTPPAAPTNAPQPAVKPPAGTPAAAGAKPAETAKPAPQASGYVVQVASFNSRKDADALKAKLAAKGYAAAISETNLNDKGTWFRVRIGRHLDKEAATQIANQLMSGAKVLPDQD